ncbi:Lrp/AsnC family transcriptional regulator [Nocardia sp. NPDC020380]|uniref:Lrp/AsnC family transcriptional regulator n=1 Tax=Nocardia sp. NPDC020380 TaxID=3364309 RepID=UPI003798BA9B
MPDLLAIDDLELKLINGLQIDPRASWSLLGSVLGIDPATAARRWNQLESDGRAWIAVYPGPASLASLVLAFIEVGCAAGEAHRVAQRLRDEPGVGTIEHITGEGDLLLTVVLHDLAALSSYVLTSLGTTPGVQSCRTHVVTSVLTEGSRWQLRVLDAAQQERIQASVPRAAHGTTPLPRPDPEFLTALELDGRASSTELAERTGGSASTMRRRLGTALSTGQVTMRCEVAQSLSGWPVSASLWCRVRPERLDAIARQLATLPETRLCCAVTGGRPNMLISVWLRSVADINRLQAALAERVPDLEILDVALALSHVKRLGRVLDEEGRATSIVPIGIWPLTAP